MNEENMTITMPLEDYNEVKKVSEFQTKVRKDINSLNTKNFEYVISKLNDVFEGKFKKVYVRISENSNSLDPMAKTQSLVIQFEI